MDLLLPSLTPDHHGQDQPKTETEKLGQKEQTEVAKGVGPLLQTDFFQVVVPLLFSLLVHGLPVRLMDQSTYVFEVFGLCPVVAGERVYS